MLCFVENRLLWQGEFSSKLHDFFEGGMWLGGSLDLLLPVIGSVSKLGRLSIEEDFKAKTALFTRRHQRLTIAVELVELDQVLEVEPGQKLSDSHLRALL